jgi:hypothetical protein
VKKSRSSDRVPEIKRLSANRHSNCPANAYINVNRVPNPIHHIKDPCVFADNNTTYWRLSCGGNVCNNCIINVNNNLSNSNFLICPACGDPVNNFFLANNPLIINSRQESNNQSILNSTQLCNICYERINEKKIYCESKSDHYLCNICYEKLLNEQKISLCPFCRTLIKYNKVNEESPAINDNAHVMN